MYDRLVKETGEVIMSKEGSMSIWNDYQVNGKSTKQGGSIVLEDDGMMHVNFQGKDGGGKFDSSTKHDSDATSPEITDGGNKFFNFNLIAMRNGNFKGTFKTPDEEVELVGLGYFQRVLINVPIVPWLWNWTVFEDGSVYSYFAPYIGLHALRR